VQAESKQDTDSVKEKADFKSWHGPFPGNTYRLQFRKVELSVNE